MRKTHSKLPAVLSVLAVAGVSLVACSPSQPVASCERVASDETVSNLVDVSGGPDAAPEVSIESSYKTDKTVFSDLTTGEGAALADTDQLAAIDMAFFSPDAEQYESDGQEGRVDQNGQPVPAGLILRTAYDGSRQPGSAAGWTSQFPGLEDALSCATAGTRMVVGLPEDGVSDAARQQYGMQGFPQEGPVIAVVDVHEVYPGAAWGSPQYNAGSNLPSVVRAPDGRPGVTVPDAPAPEDFAVQTLLKGDGEELATDDKAVLQYTGVLWETGEVFDSSWETGNPIILGEGLIEGFMQAVDGQTVGSQVMAVIPPELGYGEQGNQSIPPGSTLVFVIDIVGVQE